MANLLIGLTQQLKVLEKQYPTGLPAFYQLMSSLTFAIHTFSIKFFEGIPASQIIVWRSVLTLIILQILIQMFPCQSYPKNKGTLIKLIGRGVFGGIGFISFFLALKLTTVSEAVVLMKTNPLWTTLLVVYIYKTEKMTWKSMIEILFCIFGVILIAKPPIIMSLLGYEIHQLEFTYLYFIGLCLSLLTAFTTSITQVLISSLSKEAHQLVILQYFSLFGITMACIYQLYSPFEQFHNLNLQEMGLMIISGFLGCLAQLFMNRSMMIGDVTQMSLVGQSQIVFNILLDVLIMKQNIGIMSSIGIFMIAASLVSNIKKKNKK
ncbi:unnamed protein product [Paramecium pentaurelia]|uniref:EamA domain-containing protein n=1 Tax=Paramecium pentaurelia TaxID=43138 RepID=A0A8S1YG07_9CILI|nr:unnamed protein product [Paramecium pentaurelia]